MSEELRPRTIIICGSCGEKTTLDYLTQIFNCPKCGVTDDMTKPVEEELRPCPKWKKFLNDMLSQGNDPPHEQAAQYLSVCAKEITLEEFLNTMRDVERWLRKQMVKS